MWSVIVLMYVNLPLWLHNLLSEPQSNHMCAGHSCAPVFKQIAQLWYMVHTKTLVYIWYLTLSGTPKKLFSQETKATMWLCNTSEHLNPFHIIVFVFCQWQCTWPWYIFGCELQTFCPKQPVVYIETITTYHKVWRSAVSFYLQCNIISWTEFQSAPFLFLKFPPVI